MRFVRLGNTSLRVTDLALGTGALASRVDEKTSLAIMDCYIGEGGNFIDTANVYGRWNPGNLPLSEMMIGKWLSFHNGTIFTLAVLPEPSANGASYSISSIRLMPRF